MSAVRKTGERGVTYRVIDRNCLGRTCFAPGHFQHRGATLSGSRNTGTSTPCCLTNAYHGCPYEDGAVLKPDPALAKRRKAEGWRNA